MVHQQPLDSFGNEEQAQNDSDGKRNQDSQMRQQFRKTERQSADDSCFQMRHNAVVITEHQKDHGAGDTGNDHRSGGDKP